MLMATAWAEKDGLKMWTFLCMFMEDSTSQNDAYLLRSYHHLTQNVADDESPMAFAQRLAEKKVLKYKNVILLENRLTQQYF